MNPAGILRIEARLLWEVERDPTSGRLSADCSALGLVVEGATYSRLHTSAQQAVTLLFDHLVGTGRLEGFLREHGWVAIGPTPSRTVGVKDVDINMAFEAAGEQRGYSVPVAAH